MFFTVGSSNTSWLSMHLQTTKSEWGKFVRA
jgi:hypothetical protein